MRRLTLIQAALLAVLTVFGAYAAHETPAPTAPDPACLELSERDCGL